MDKNNISDKIKLYLALHGNNIASLAIHGENCEECRAKNEGICNIRYGHDRQVLYEIKTGKIIEISKLGQFVPWASEYLKNKGYNQSQVSWVWFCIGFLITNNENRETSKKV